MAQTELNFGISGEFVTDIARTWFWEEKQPYEKSENLLLDCLVTDELTRDEKRTLVRDILEYRKCLTGVNTFFVEEDPGPVRSLTERLKDLEFTTGVQALRQRLEIDPIPFVDPYSTVKSIKALEEGITKTKPPFTRIKCIQYFAYTEPDIRRETREELQAHKAPLWAGLWLFDELELAYQVCQDITCHVGDRAFWDEVYQRTKDREGFEERNMRYLASRRREKEKEEWFRKSFEEIYPDVSFEEEKEEKHLWSTAEPDDMLCWEGLIDPKGNFYSCEFGAHNAKAYTILHTNIEYWKKVLDKQELDDFLCTDKALDILVAHGWCATRELPFTGEYITYPTNGHITRAQKDRIWDAIIKFDKHPGYEDILM